MKTEQHTNQLEQLIQLATREDLISFIRIYAKENASFKKELQAFLGNKYVGNSKTTDDYIKMMSAAFQQTKSIGSRWHSFEVTDWESVFADAMKVMRKGEKMLEVGNADAAATIAVEFFHVFSKEFDIDTFFDDDDDLSDGGYECEAAEKLLLNAINHPFISQKTQKKLLEELRSISATSFAYELDNYGIFDFDAMILNVNKMVMTDEDTLSLLNTQIEQHKGKYDEHTYVERKLELLRQMGRDEDADNTETEYLHLPEIRRKAILRFTEVSAFDKAIAYAEEGARLASTTNNYCSTDSWLEMLLDVYVKNGDKEKQKEVLRKLFISSGGDSERYHQLKQLIEPGTWQGYLNNLLSEANLSSHATWGKCNLADIYAEEGYTDKLFQIIMENSEYDTDVLNTYSEYVKAEHSEEMLQRYTELLKRDAERNVNAKAYHRIAYAMKKMTKLKGGEDAAHQLAVFFRMQYKRRSSMMAEIREF